MPALLPKLHVHRAQGAVGRVFSEGIKEDMVLGWSPEGGAGEKDLDYLWQKLTSHWGPNLCLL